MKRLKGVCDLCVRKISVSGAAPPALNHHSSLESSSKYLSSRRQSLGNHCNLARQQEVPDLRKGVRTLKRVIRLVDTDRG